MAITGGATVAYVVTADGDELESARTTKMRKDCMKVDDALAALVAGKTATVKGGDMADLRRQWIVSRETLEGD